MGKTLFYFILCQKQQWFQEKKALVKRHRNNEKKKSISYTLIWRLNFTKTWREMFEFMLETYTENKYFLIELLIAREQT